MKKHNKMLLTLLSTAFTIGLALAESTGGGNGGGGIVCIEANGKRTVRLLDLQEATRAGFTIVRSSAPWPAQLEQALEKYAKLHPDYVSLMRKELKRLETNTIDVAGRRLPPPSDTNLSILEEPRNCFLEGVADYNDNTRKLHLDGELDALMSETDRAALRFHEAWYRVQRARMSHTTNSQAARKITGAVFAQEPLQSAQSDAENALVKCISEDDKFAFSIVPQAMGVELVFSKIAGLTINEKASVLIPTNKGTRYVDIEGDLLNALEEGLRPSKHKATKAERKLLFSSTPMGYGTSNVNFKHALAHVSAQYAAPMRLVIGTTDWVSVEGESLVESVSRGTPVRSQFDIVRHLKTAYYYENVGTHVALIVPGVETYASYGFLRKYGSRVNCQ